MTSITITSFINLKIILKSDPNSKTKYSKTKISKINLHDLPMMLDGPVMHSSSTFSITKIMVEMKKGM